MFCFAEPSSEAETFRCSVSAAVKGSAGPVRCLLLAGRPAAREVNGRAAPSLRLSVLTTSLWRQTLCLSDVSAALGKTNQADKCCY